MGCRQCLERRAQRGGSAEGADGRNLGGGERCDPAVLMVDQLEDPVAEPNRLGRGQPDVVLDVEVDASSGASRGMVFDRHVTLRFTGAEVQ